VPWLRRLVAGLSPRRLGLDPVSAHVGSVMDKVALRQVFPQVLRFPLSVSFHRCYITRKNEKKERIIFITGLHNKPEGCRASVASAALRAFVGLVIILKSSPLRRGIRIFNFNIRHPCWYVHAKVYFTLISSTVTTNTYTCDT
jgi:hypothetical protein